MLYLLIALLSPLSSVLLYINKEPALGFTNKSPQEKAYYLFLK